MASTSKTTQAHAQNLIPKFKHHPQVEISSTTWLDWDTGQESAFADVNCGTFYYGGADATATYSNCSIGGGSGANVSTATNTSEGCKNSLSSVCYTVSKTLSNIFYVLSCPSLVRFRTLAPIAQHFYCCCVFDPAAEACAAANLRHLDFCTSSSASACPLAIAPASQRQTRKSIPPWTKSRRNNTTRLLPPTVNSLKRASYVVTTNIALFIADVYCLLLTNTTLSTKTALLLTTNACF